MKVKEFAKIVNGSTPSSKHPEYYGGNIIWITPKDLSDQNSKYICKGERTITDAGYNSCSTQIIPAYNILMSSRAPIGLLSINTVDCCTNQGFKSFIIDKTKCDVDYLYYYLKYHIKEIEALGSGTTFKEVSKESIENYDVLLTDLELQKRISKIVSAIDDKISNNNRMNSELESMAKTIYDYWFTQFDFPDENGKPYRSSGGKMVWNDELKREIPEGWRFSNVGSFIKSEKGGDWGNDEEQGNYKYKVTCIRGADFPSIMKGGELNTPTRFILEKNTYKILAPNDIIVEISGGSPTQSTGRICYINNNVLKRFENPVITSNFCKAFSLENECSFHYFYLMWQQLYDNGVFFKYEGKTTGIKNLLFDTLCVDYKLAIPPKDILEKFNLKMKVLFDKIQKNSLENQQLASLRDWLLPMLMNGQIVFKENQKKPIQIKVSCFEQWLSNQGFAARGDVDNKILKEIYEAMDEDDK